MPPNVLIVVLILRMHSIHLLSTNVICPWLADNTCIIVFIVQLPMSYQVATYMGPIACCSVLARWWEWQCCRIGAVCDLSEFAYVLYSRLLPTVSFLSLKLVSLIYSYVICFEAWLWLLVFESECSCWSCETQLIFIISYQFGYLWLTILPFIIILAGYISLPLIWVTSLYL